MGTVINDAWIVESLGELRLAVGALTERIERLENRCAKDEAELLKTVRAKDIADMWDCLRGSALEEPRTLTGSVQGLEGVFTITPPPEWDRSPDDERWAAMVDDACQNPTPRRKS